MSPRASLRAAVLTAVAAGAVLLPSAAAFADDAVKPKPTPEVSTPATAEPSPVPTRDGTSDAERKKAEPTSAPVPAESVPAGTLPRGGVAAGERAAEESGSASALYGSAAGAVLLAGVGTFVLRRRSAAHRNG
ncbi:hypothetical protein OG596_04525 [Streptomyces sp. NBC_01102]|uniref:hypothetical protein n=1 Tax=unclassified Streptomyces TaxID=2593676 RepID=UPI00386BF4A0|nr:hypothetical protein OG596_04525 [Streptomyces sp. NBC_01102]